MLMVWMWPTAESKLRAGGVCLCGFCSCCCGLFCLPLCQLLKVGCLLGVRCAASDTAAVPAVVACLSQRQGILDADTACQRQTTAAVLCLQTRVSWFGSCFSPAERSSSSSSRAATKFKSKHLGPVSVASSAL
jgi:hypothetical protein